MGLHIAVPQFRTVCWVERDAYAASTLVARMEDESLDEAPIWSDITTFDAAAWRGKLDICTAGYPCQPFSSSGKRRGQEDPRHLWPHVARIAAEAEVPILFCENVHGHLSLGFKEVRNDLRHMGYQVEAGLFSASEVGASHQRMRLFILAYTHSELLRDLAGGADGKEWMGVQTGRTSDEYRCSGEGLDGHDAAGSRSAIEVCGGFAPNPHDYKGWQEVLAISPDLKPMLPRAAHGMANRLDRQRLAGNGVVPLAAAYAWSTLVANATKQLR